MDDIKFSSADLVDGILILENIPVGSFCIEDNHGNLILAPQRRVDNTTEIDLTDFEIEEYWTIRLLRGYDGVNSSGGITSEEAMLYAIIYG